jgi:hypothetical protein
MDDKNPDKDKPVEGVDKEVPEKEVPQVETPQKTETEPPVPEPPKETKPLSDDAIDSLKESISKDVSGKVTTEVSKGILAKIGDALGLTKTETEELPKDKTSLEKIIDETVQKRLKESDDAILKNREKEEADRKEEVNKVVRNWFTQYNELAALKKVPAILNENDNNDKGRIARNRLIQAIGTIVNEKRKIDPTTKYIPSISEVLVRFPDILMGAPGADLPISGNTRVTETEDSYSYPELHNKSFEEIANENT